MTKEINLAFKMLKERIGSKKAVPFDEFIEFALYHPEIGYYVAKKNRVGKGEESDFYTSNSHGKLWGELIIDSCEHILGRNQINKYAFIEIAAEPNCSVLKEINHPFKVSKVFRLGDPVEIPDHSIVFSNEWLDAQPFKRYRFNKKKLVWEEIGLSIIENEIIEVCIPTCNVPSKFCRDSIHGYTIDWPVGAHTAMQKLLSKSWKGMFLTFDYGLSSKIILKERPMGTARAYYKHQHCDSLFSRIGEQDLTCQLCWDELSECLVKNDFFNINLQSQESFLIHNAKNRIKSIFENVNKSPNSDMLKLRELIHPQHFGMKFQALWGIRK